MTGAKKGRNFQFKLFLSVFRHNITFRVIMSFRKPCIPHAIPQTHSIFYPHRVFGANQAVAYIFAGSTTKRKESLTSSHGRLAFLHRHKDSVAFISRVAWQHRYYIKKVGHLRKDLLEGHDQFRFNFFSAKDNCTINFTLFFFLSLFAFETA